MKSYIANADVISIFLGLNLEVFGVEDRDVAVAVAVAVGVGVGDAQTLPKISIESVGVVGA